MWEEKQHGVLMSAFESDRIVFTRLSDVWEFWDVNYNLVTRVTENQERPPSLMPLDSCKVILCKLYFK